MTKITKLKTHRISVKNILVTGGAGFIGSNFIRYLYHHYPTYRIFNYDLLTYAGNLDNLRDLVKLEANKTKASKRYFFIQGDIGDEKLLDKLFAKHKFDIVVNFAAESHVDRSIISSQNFIKVNVMGVHILIDLAKKYQTSRFIHISTDEIYGDIGKGQSTEKSHLKPSNPYAASKAAADFLVQSYIRTHNFPAIIVRGSNNFGLYQYPEKLIPLAITNLLEGRLVPVHGGGHHVRTWLHVEDFCRAIDVVMHHAKVGSIYNVAGQPKKNRDVIKEICHILNKDFNTHIRFVSDRPGADFRYAPTASKLEKELGWRATKTIDANLKEIVEWYKQNTFWWKKIKKKKEFLEHYKKQSRSLYY
jgi:dTDP-glucose 4,6-dehydratase